MFTPDLNNNDIVSFPTFKSKFLRHLCNKNDVMKLFTHNANIVENITNTVEKCMELGDRFKSRREALNLTQDEVAKEVSRLLPNDRFSRVTVSNIELGNQQSLKDRVLLAVIKILKCNAEWLVNGNGDIEPTTNNIALFESTPVNSAQMVPLVSWVQAGQWTEAVDNYDNEFVACPVKCPPGTFALKIRGDSMQPRFEENDIIFIDSNQVNIENGKLVIAQLEASYEATFKQLQVIDGKKYLRALNPDYPPELKFVPINGNCRLIGTVISHVKPI